VNSESHIAWVSSPGLLSCNEFRTFWVGWLDGYIRVGLSHRYGYNEIVSLENPKPHPVNYLSFVTSTSEGAFDIEGDRGEWVGWGFLVFILWLYSGFFQSDAFLLI
jgi:Farnesoic acid 0-methyl transferase